MGRKGSMVVGDIVWVAASTLRKKGGKLDRFTSTRATAFANTEVYDSLRNKN